MAYISQEQKAKLAPTIKAILKKYGIRGSISVRNHSSLVLTLKSGKIDFVKNINETCGRDPYQSARGFKPLKSDAHIQVNPYHYRDHYSGKARKFLDEIIPALKGPDYFDESDAQVDYFHTSHYFSVNIGKWDAAYIVEA